jgi:lambda repressor-like predicted transcriptional regulator
MLEKHKENAGHFNGKLTYGQKQIEWHRAQVLSLSAEGYTVREIAQKLQVGHITVDNDLLYLRKQAQENLQHHIHEVVPEEYQKCMVGMKRNLKQTLEIAENTSDPKIKLEARRIANDCYRYIMDLCTNAGIVNEALKFVTQKQQQIDTLKKIDERINNEAVEEETTETTNGVF